MSKRYISFPLPPEMKEVNFKMLFEIYPTSDFLRLRFNLDVTSCVFCDRESLDHLFFLSGLTCRAGHSHGRLICHL